MKTYPLKEKSLFTEDKQTFASIGIKINPSLEGVLATKEMLLEPSSSGRKKLLSLEFNWLPVDVVNDYNLAETDYQKKEVLVKKVYGNCPLNCKGCYVKQDDLFKNKKLVSPEKILDLIKEAVLHLGTKTLKYLGPSEFFRDKNVFKYLEEFEKMDVILGVFAKDPMFGDDEEVEAFFGDYGLKSSEDFVKKISSYKNLRILFNFRSFDEEKTNYLVKGGYNGKIDYVKNYKIIQNRSLQLLYKYFVKAEIKKGLESRLVIVNTPITKETIDEAFEIFTYFIDRAIPVVSTTSMQSGCGGTIYENVDKNFIEKLEDYYINAIKYSLKRGLISEEYFKSFGPSPYAGIIHCMQLCNGLLIRETGQIMRCPGADNEEWQDSIVPEELMEKGLLWAWKKTKNYFQNSEVNIGCLAKPKIFTNEFKAKIIHEIENC